MTNKKKVLLLGDSIRLNAQPFVKTFLPKDFEVYGPQENCESSANLLQNLDRWIDPAVYFHTAHEQKLNWHVIHINAGLHDIRFNPGLEHPVATLKVYQKHLKSIFEKITLWRSKNLLLNSTKIIWASSTPFDELVHNREKPSKRYEEHLITYNQSAINLALEYKFLVNHLYEKLCQQDCSQLWLADGLHFNDKGNALIGRLISDAIISA